jgi:Gpi18-like mannosyltransferase
MRGDANDTQRPSRILIAAALLVAIVPFYRWSWNTAPPDMAEFLVPWFRHIVAAGRLEAFSAPFSNYSPPYLYLLALSSWLDGLAATETIIRLLSLLIAGALGLALWRLVRGTALIAVLPFAVPSVIVNAALLGQCDALWAAPCLLAVAAAVRRSPG